MKSPISLTYELAVLLGFLGVLAWSSHLNPTLFP
jgi:hypothetical protein